MEKRNAYFALLALLLGAGLFVLAGSRAAAPPAGLTPFSAMQSSASPQSGEEMSRKALDKLIGEQKFEEAAKEAARIREAAKRKGNQTVWTWALIKEAQLRTALHGYETAVRFFKDEAWPDSPADRDMLDLYYAQSLITYYQSYSWDINKRERVDAKVPVDLKSWTRDQIFGEAWAAIMRVWKDRDRLADLRPKDYPDFWNPGDYPTGIRDTLRDSVVYLIAGMLVDTSFWTPRQTNETYLLALGKLLDPTFDAKSTAEALDSPSAHPLEKAAALLAEHESWSRSANRPEAALEARLVLFETLHGAFSQEDDRALIRTRLAELLPAYRKHSWWTVGQAILAEFTREENTPDALVRARAIALKGAEAYPLSPGGKRCESIVKKIEAPEFSVEAMKNDSAGRRSVQVTHRNMGRLFFRAYPVDLVAAIKSSKDYNILPGWKETQAALDHQKPAASWKVDLPPAPDYRDHWTYAELPTGLAPGSYIVAASAREDFLRKQNRILALNVLVSDLVLLSRGESDGGNDVLVLSGESGRPIAGVSVDLYAYDWRKGHHVVETRPTDAQGRTRFLSRPEGGNYFLLARTANDLALNPDYLYLNAVQERAESTDALIYTDRSIYRPGQKIFWKILVFRGRRDLGRLRPAASSAASVWLEDINGQRVAQLECATNSFGTASGEFLIPAAGRPLGAWRLRASPNGYAQVRVEEYKRPTFEVTVKDPVKPLRLNKPAALTAEARYYFGLPVASGAVVWQVRREPVYPRWWWGGEGEGTRIQVVAGGRGQVKKDGTIEVAFTPGADERKAGAGVSYRYTLSVDVTDEGGETRSATRSFRLGFVSVEAAVSAENGFGRADTPSVFSITRSDLNGTPKPGKGTWRVVRLVQPPAALLPADQPLPELSAGAEPGAFQTPGDRRRPRWEASLPAESILSLWKDGREAASGNVEHDARGEAKAAVPALEAGAYRLVYKTKDEFGAVCRENLDFLVAGKKTSVSLPLVLSAERTSVRVGETARFLIHSGLPGQPLLFETFKGGELWERRWIEAGKDSGVLEIPVTEEMRGGFGARITAVRDHQDISGDANVFVPWDNKELDLSFSSFRDKLTPGGRETWRVTVKTPGGKLAVQGAAELLAYMYDRILDLFAPHRPPRLLGLYPDRMGTPEWEAALGPAPQAFDEDSGWVSIPSFPVFRPDFLVNLSGYGIGGPGGRRYGPVGGVREQAEADATVTAAVPVIDVKHTAKATTLGAEEAALDKKAGKPGQEPAAQEAAVPLRSNFSETAFWKPHLLTGADGTATIEFVVPDSVTSWRVFVHGVTQDLAGGTLEKEARTVKELMVRPYLPRFFREGDKAELRVMVNDAGDKEMAGEVALEIFDPVTNENLAPAFGLPAQVPARAFAVKAGGGTAVTFPLAAPARVGAVAFKVTAKAGAFSDGELRPLPVLPGRMHLVQSRFATLKGAGAARELRFADLEKADDATRVNEQLVVTVDGQLFYGLLEALPYLMNYPYECTEQTLNRFMSAGILTSLYDKYPSVARMAQALSKRETVYETFDAADPNRKMGLEETPWLVEARGGTDAGFGIEKVLDPRVAEAQREASLAKLLKAQTSLGAFPWWPGGPPSPYMTLYIVHGFSKALEFGASVPKDPVVRAFGYLHRHYLDEIVSMLMAHDTGWEFVTFLNYTLSNFPDATWTGGVFTDGERTRMLDFSFKHWKDHSPYLKGFLSLTLKRAGRVKDAALVWDSVMDSARTTTDEGTSWAPEDRGWLWYNDTIETHAFALRTLMELRPADARSEGLVQWLFLNKKLNHWKSTRATAEVIYSVAYFLKRTGGLGVREAVTAEACGTRTTFTFEPDQYTGKKNQVVIPGDKVGPNCATVRVSKEGKGMAFASATWHFSTERMPAKGEGDLFAVERSYFKREKKGDEVVLKPLADGAGLAVGDEIEVQLSIRARHPAEYVHLRDPRPSGCEPVTLTSGYKWDLGIVRYEEIRDSGTNFFMEWLPQGEYTLKHRMRCAMAGTFKAAPATLQSMYAPEFAAYSSGALLTVK
ncbi:MAG: alpha-2-macroglobulin family protein [Candidatus Aminicenantales bacterium]